MWAFDADGSKGTGEYSGKYYITYKWKISIQKLQIFAIFS